MTITARRRWPWLEPALYSTFFTMCMAFGIWRATKGDASPAFSFGALGGVGLGWIAGCYSTPATLSTREAR